jgi:hypothetical protein
MIGMVKETGPNFQDMNNYAFCTLVYGEKYTELSKTLIEQLTSLGETIFVYTDQPNEFVDNDLVKIIPYTKPYFSFHEKLTVMKECLNHYETAVFLDADVVLKDIDDMSFLKNIDTGLHIFATFGNIGDTFLSNDINICDDQTKRNTKYGNQGKELLNKLNYKYKKQYHKNMPEDYLEHYLEGKWIIKKDNGNEEKFFNIWENIAPFCEEFDIKQNYVNNVGAGEGSVMSIACYNSGINYKGVSPLISIFNAHFISNYKEKTEGTKPWNIAG